MGFKMKKVIVGEGEERKSYSATKVTELAYTAADAITLNGFNSVKELNDLLTVNCKGSNVIINQCLKELAIRYNERATKESELIHLDPDLRNAHITNCVLMNNKLKIIADARTYVATNCSDNIQALPIFAMQTNYIGCEPSSLENVTEDKEEKVVTYRHL